MGKLVAAEFVPPDAWVLPAIKTEVAATPDLSGTEARIAMEDGSVIQSGSVRLYHQSTLFEKIARQTSRA